MRDSLEHQRLLGDFGSESQPKPSTPSSARHRHRESSSPLSKSPGSRLACAFSALKCSSRALEDDHLPVIVPPSTTDLIDNSRTLLDGQAKHSHAPPLSPRTLIRSKVVTKDSSEQSLASHESDTTGSSRLLELTGIDIDDNAPFEDSEEEDAQTSSTPHRTQSDDTPETPNVSNRDPTRPPLPKSLLVQTRPDPEYDEFCQSNFNTPRMLHCNGSLGDDISPLVSPDNQSEESDRESETCDAYFGPFSNHASKRDLLLLPTMAPPVKPSSRNSLLSEASTMSMLFGEAIPEEKKVADEIDHILTTIKSNTCGTDESTLPDLPSTSSALQQCETTGRTPSETYQTLPREDSSYSTVSSFIDTTKDRPPFFWRSHPNVTVYSQDMQQRPAPSRQNLSYPAKNCSCNKKKHNIPPWKDQSGSHTDLGAVKELLFNHKAFGLTVNMSSFTSFATDRIYNFRRRTSSSQ